jgi:hypothetical protein
MSLLQQAFGALAKAVAAVRKYAPGKLATINLYPNYATIWQMNQVKSQLGTATYTEYLERFVNEVKPMVISYDNYMVGNVDGPGKQGKINQLLYQPGRSAPHRVEV